jgi:hypothetical protein
MFCHQVEVGIVVDQLQVVHGVTLTGIVPV